MFLRSHFRGRDCPNAPSSPVLSMCVSYKQGHALLSSRHGHQSHDVSVSSPTQCRDPTGVLPVAPMVSFIPQGSGRGPRVAFHGWMLLLSVCLEQFLGLSLTSCTAVPPDVTNQLSGFVRCGLGVGFSARVSGRRHRQGHVLTSLRRLGSPAPPTTRDGRLGPSTRRWAVSPRLLGIKFFCPLCHHCAFLGRCFKAIQIPIPCQTSFVHLLCTDSSLSICTGAYWSGFSEQLLKSPPMSPFPMLGPPVLSAAA